MSSSKVEIETLDCARFLGEITKGYRGWWYPGLMGLRGQSKSTGSEKAERLTPRNGGQLLRGWNSDFGNWSTLFETTKPARDRLDLDCCFSFGQQRLKRFDELKLIPIFLSFFLRSNRQLKKSRPEIIFWSETIFPYMKRFYEFYSSIIILDKEKRIPAEKSIDTKLRYPLNSIQF